MALIEEYYELNEAEEVPAVWKAIQIIFYVSAGCLGLWCGYTIALLRIKFEDKCYLFTKIRLPTLREKFDLTTINWEIDSYCDYCQYSMVSSFIVATIWATFFLMCGKGGKSLTGLPQPWRIVWPSFVFNFIYFIVVLSTAINIQKGTDHFCNRPQFDKRIKTKSLLENCEPLRYLVKTDLYVTALQMEIVSKSSWGCAVSWFILVLISIFRIIFVVDFHIYKVCVFKVGDTVHNKKEEVLRVTNYEEPKKLPLSEDNSDFPHNSEFDENVQNVEGKKKKSKSDKKLRQVGNLTNVSTMQPNTTFYLTADIRMLNRDKKRKKLDEAFDKNSKTDAMEKKRVYQTIGMHVGDNVEATEYSTQLFQYNTDSEVVFNEEDEHSSSSTIQTEVRYIETEGESAENSEIYITDVIRSRSMQMKKFL